jgi:hypothetical protein
MSSYTENEILDRLTEALKQVESLYKEPFINYSGVTSDTKKPYSEIIAKKLLTEIEKFNKIEPITRENSYKVDSHKGKQNDGSNRKEELLALSMFRNQNKYDYIGKIIDYQVPLKNKRSDEAGKIDLLSNNLGKELILLELKSKDNLETLLRCVLEIATYWHLIDRRKLCKDFSYLENTIVKKAVLVYLNGSQHEEYKNNPNIRTLMETLDVGIFLFNLEKDQINQIQVP